MAHFLRFMVQLCSIAPGQEYRRKLNEMQTTNMIRAAVTTADVRKKKIEDAMKDMNFNNDHYAKNFGISVDNKMVQLDGMSAILLTNFLFNFLKFLSFFSTILRARFACSKLGLWSRRVCIGHSERRSVEHGEPEVH